MTISERRLWVCLRSDFEVKFRRQEPIGSFICDFVCYSRRLVVEVDGSQHLDNPRDVERDRYLRRKALQSPSDTHDQANVGISL